MATSAADRAARAPTPPTARGMEVASASCRSLERLSSAQHKLRRADRAYEHLREDLCCLDGQAERCQGAGRQCCLLTRCLARAGSRFCPVLPEAPACMGL